MMVSVFLSVSARYRKLENAHHANSFVKFVACADAPLMDVRTNNAPENIYERTTCSSYSERLKVLSMLEG